MQSTRQYMIAYHAMDVDYATQAMQLRETRGLWLRNSIEMAREYNDPPRCIVHVNRHSVPFCVSRKRAPLATDSLAKRMPSVERKRH